MINSQHAQLLREAVALCDRNKVDSAFQQVLREEIGGLMVGNEVQNHLKKIISNLTVPYEVEVGVQPVNLSVVNEPQPRTGKTVLKLVGCFLMLVAVSLLSVYWNIKVGIGAAVLLTGVCALYFYRQVDADKSQHPSVNIPAPQVSVKPRLDAETLIETANRIMKELTYLADELESPAPAQLPLHECYPNILVWLQMVYEDGLDFDDEEAKEYILKRVPTVALECNYEIRVYDGNNQSSFKVVESEGVNEPRMRMPAIVYIKTNKVILPGLLFVPEKVNTED